MDKTVSRIILATKSVTDIVLDDNSKEFTLIPQWGCAGSTGHSEYKQRSLEDASDTEIFYHTCTPSSVVFNKNIWR
jgi:hypothetical protein